MASTRWRAATGLIDQLKKLPARFDFFQAVRVLNWIKRRDGALGSVGRDLSPRDESVRFSTKPTLAFPSSAVADVNDSESDNTQDGKVKPAGVQVTFMGLTGTGGVLPEHYTDLIIQRARSKDYALRDFFDIFNHRALSLHYRAWEKYRLPVQWERSLVDGAVADDAYSLGLHSLVGMGTGHLRNRLSVRDDFFLFFSGHFSRQIRSVTVMRQILEAYLGLEVDVQQFQGRWFKLPPEQRTRLPKSGCQLGQFNRLGLGPKRPGPASDSEHREAEYAIAGRRVWDVSSKFRLRIGPLEYRDFQALLPGGALSTAICELTRMYAGLGLDFDLQLVLRANEVPPCRLSGLSSVPRQRLGRDAWLTSKGLMQDADQAVFRGCLS